MNIKYSMEIAASAHELFELTQNYSKRNAWDPLTSEAYLLNLASAAEGGLVRCTAKNGLSMDTVYVSYKPDKVAAVKMVKGPYIFDKFAGGWCFEPLDGNKTRVKFSYTITTRPKCLSWLLTPLLVAVFKFETRKRLHALRRYAEAHSDPETTLPWNEESM